MIALLWTTLSLLPPPGTSAEVAQEVDAIEVFLDVSPKDVSLAFTTLASDYQPLWALSRALGESIASWQRTWAQLLEQVHKSTGVHMDQDPSRAAVFVDWTESGDLAFAMAFFDSKPTEPQATGMVSIQELGDVRMAWHHVLEWGWSVPEPSVLVVGNRRGVERMLRWRSTKESPWSHLRQAPKPGRDPAWAVRVRHLERIPEAQGVWAAIQEELGDRLATAELVQAKDGAALFLTAKAGAAVSGLGDAWSHLVQGGAELWLSARAILRAWPEAGARPLLHGWPLRKVPEQVLHQVDELLAQGTISAKSFERPGHVIETRLTYASGAAVLLASGLVTLWLSESFQAPPRQQAERLLTELYQAQQQYRERSGAYLPCGPVPRRVSGKLSGERALWPQGTCFDALGVTPQSADIQLEARLEQDRLLLIARAPAVSGLPQIWWLTDNAPHVRGSALSDAVTFWQQRK